MKLQKYKKDPNAPSAEDKALAKFADKMIERMEEMEKVDWKKGWFCSTGIMAQNIEGRVYGGANQMFLLLMTESEGWKAPIFVTFEKINSMNYDEDNNYLPNDLLNYQPKVSVNKGAISNPAFFTTYSVTNKETKEKITMSEYLKLTDEEKENYYCNPRTHVVNVFNIDQTNLEESRPELYASLVAKNKTQTMDKSKEYHFGKLDDMIKQQGWVCPIHLKKQDRAYFSPTRDEICLPEYKQFVSGQEFYATLLHEMAHSTGHSSRLNRIKLGDTGKDYGREELVAEFTAALSCYSYGIINGIDKNNVAYLKGWCKNIKEDPKFLKTILNDAKNAYNMIHKYVDVIQ